MVLPQEIGDAAQDADTDRVIAWLDAGGSINDTDFQGYTLVNCCAAGGIDRVVNDRHVALTRHLIALGADVNIAARAETGTPWVSASAFAPMHEICQRAGEGQAVLEMLSLLLGAGANVNARDRHGRTPLWHVIYEQWPERCLTMITKLLRAGASLDACNGDKAAEDIIKDQESVRPNFAEDEDWVAAKRLVAGVRKYGSYKRYARSFHRDVLVCRGLAQRGKLRTDDPVLNFLARLGDNGVCWHILSFWRATN